MVTVVHHLAGGLAAAAIVLACVSVWTLVVVAMAAALSPAPKQAPDPEGDPHQ